MTGSKCRTPGHPRLGWVEDSTQPGTGYEVAEYCPMCDADVPKVQEHARWAWERGLAEGEPVEHYGRAARLAMMRVLEGGRAEAC
ncbi:MULTISPECIES: hypothetical protein [Actinomadura]|uniref:Uncharacterized protein n=1 Tax=Actinomadura yumaensis TaxID=111807 RepID=A0ABW2CWN5_9ACTN|nr:hypothetical protein [Actinomadura sp. J1-007]MWK32721.1 hypothetical protein [Actinomadura sp. J1-007]